ncbi:Protein-tyrosine-phosphatase PTP1, partial [Cucurbita argyrosperma subsp. sororia]
MIKQAHSLIQIPNELQFITAITRFQFRSSIHHFSAFQIRPLGNLTSTRSRNHRRRSPMAASAAGNPSSSSSSSSNPFIFSPDSPPRLALTPHQIKLCSEALEAFKEKLQMPDVINQEFARLQAQRITASDMKKNCSVALDNVNISKNRYTDVLPFDETRVVLDSCKDYRPSAKGYINASLISSSSSESLSKFIATQGPLPHTYEDFWEMVLQYKCPAILMLTRLIDNYKTVKCGDYFPAEDGSRDFGNLVVVSKWIKSSNSSLILRHLEVNHKESEERVAVLHIQYPEWPDHGVPNDTLAVREMLKRLYHLPPDLGPIVVHCSADPSELEWFKHWINTFSAIEPLLMNYKTLYLFHSRGSKRRINDRPYAGLGSCLIKSLLDLIFSALMKSAAVVPGGSFSRAAEYEHCSLWS